MRWALFFVFGIGALAGLVGYWFWTIDATRDEMRAFCSLTRRGQSWREAKERAESKGFEVVGYGGDEQLVSTEAMDRRFGCVVVVAKNGMVLESRFAEGLAR